MNLRYFHACDIFEIRLPTTTTIIELELKTTSMACVFTSFYSSFYLFLTILGRGTILARSPAANLLFTRPGRGVA